MRVRDGWETDETSTQPVCQPRICSFQILTAGSMSVEMGVGLSAPIRSVLDGLRGPAVQSADRLRLAQDWRREHPAHCKPTEGSSKMQGAASVAAGDCRVSGIFFSRRTHETVNRPVAVVHLFIVSR